MVNFFRGIADSNMPDRRFRIGFGALSAALGVAILLWPAPAVLFFVVFASVYTLIFGVLEIVEALRIKNS
jgi:uncharacterized membrane protein HdeD (DUF308 family)